MKRSRHHRAAETRRFYYVDMLLATGDVRSYYSDERRAKAFLQRLLIRVWREEGRAGQGYPDLQIDNTKGAYSYCEGRRLIVLATRQTCITILLHEIVHALGYARHDKRFVRRYLQLLVKYGRCEEGPILIFLGLNGIYI